jgi:hypothetical protein
MIEYPRVKVCAAHVAPVFLDTERTVAKALAYHQARGPALG